MKNFLIFFIFSLFTTSSYGGVHVTEITEETYSDSFPVFVMPSSFEVIRFLKGTENHFDMNYKISSGGMAFLNLHKNLTLLAGGRLWTNLSGNKLNSWSFAQYGIHSGFGILYNQKIQKSRFMCGPVLGTVFYVPAGIPEGSEYNVSFQNFSQKIRENRSYVRGIYWNAPYVFVQWDKYRDTGERESQVELNLLIPGRFPPFVLSFQPNSLVHAMRLKVLYDWKNFSLKGDVQLPVLLGEDKNGSNYRNIRFPESTYKTEVGYSLLLSGGKIKFIVGFERDWHALYFPTLSKEKGTWGALYVGSRYEFLATKWMKIPQKN